MSIQKVNPLCKVSKIKICRACLSKGEIPIFGDTEELNLSNEIVQLTNVNISIDDNYPKYLCKSCHNLLKAALIFKNIIQKSDHFLKQTFSKTYCKEEESNNTSSVDMDIYHSNQEVNSKDVIYCSQDCNISGNKEDESENEQGKNEALIIIMSETDKESDGNLEEKNCSEFKLADDSVDYENSCLDEISMATISSKDTTDPMLQKTMEGITLIECTYCKKQYKKQYLKIHLAIHKDVSRYICEVCGKKFYHQSTLKTHRLIHNKDLPFQCQFCPYRGRHLGLLKVHVRTHTKEYNHKCTECSARFITKSNLNKHMKRHKGPIDFTCATCERGFYSKTELTKHIDVEHFGIKSHICSICGKAFGYRNGMMSHQLKVHKREKITQGKGRQPLYVEYESKLPEFK